MKKQSKNTIESSGGITLIALVVTIIVLLILAGIVIMALTGENGILNQAINANKQTDIAGTKEQIKLELVGRYDDEGDYTNDDVIEAVKTVTGQTVEEGAATVITAKGNKVDISDLWCKSTEEEETGGPQVDTIPTDTNYEGYYADIDADGTVDGVIYADLMAGATSGTWSTSQASTYSYTAITEAKDYYVNNQSYTDDFGTKPVLSPVEGTTGNDRFYIMTLDNFTTSSYITFYWYYSAFNNGMSDYSTYTSYAFGTGKANTEAMITKWNSAGYGSQNARDLWGVIQTKVNEGWFIPSKKEWSAFGAKLGITSSNYSSTFGLSDAYWSSSQEAKTGAVTAYFKGGSTSDTDTKYDLDVRLGTTF